MIKTINLDSYFDVNDYDKIDFIKMDIEGSEYGAIKGMRNIIKNNKKIKMLVEFHPSSILEYGKEPKQFLEMLYSMDFKLTSLDKITENRKRISINNEGEIDQLISRSDQYTTNLLCER